MKEIERIQPKKLPTEQTAYEWLSEIPSHHWAREQPIIDMFESIRRKLMSRIQVKGKLVGYLCCHAIAAISYHRLNFEDYVDDYFKKEAYLRVYRHMINPVPGMHDYEESNLGIVNPPHVATKVGRPKKIRRRDVNDLKDGNMVSRNGFQLVTLQKRNEPQHTQTEEVSQFSENIASTYESWFSQPLHSEVHKDNVPNHRAPVAQPHANSTEQMLSRVLVDNMSAPAPVKSPRKRKQQHPISKTSKSQLRSISGTYKPKPSAESSSSKTQHASVHKE
ncbi:UNVERIFIED_CONTAM: hypothetical protein Sradi_2012500 [Sesamum radiatum]|uniref:Uncharacterized protein n=1 Tax=Sesamum radiatum TaxID=300843 RepID=A0AAW2THD7_SESRA